MQLCSRFRITSKRLYSQLTNIQYNNKHIYRHYTRTFFKSTTSINSDRYSKYQQYTYSKTNNYHPFYRHNTNYCSSSSSPSSPSSSPKTNELLDNIQDIEIRRKCRLILDCILLDPRTKMPLNEYNDLCFSHNLDDLESKKLLSALHTTGLIWHFPKYFESNSPLIIKTNEICAAFLRTLDLNGDIRNEFTSIKTSELKQLLLEIKPLEEQHEEIELYARKYVRNLWRIFFGYVVGHCMLIPYLTFWKYSWDIMEPVTYMFNLWSLFMGTWFFLNTSADFSNEGISSAILRMRKEKLYKKYNFNIDRYTFLQEKIAEIEDDLLNPEWQMLKSVHPGLPDYIKHIHLTPAQLIKKYEIEEKKESETLKT